MEQSILGVSMLVCLWPSINTVMYNILKNQYCMDCVLSERLNINLGRSKGGVEGILTCDNVRRSEL